MAELIQMGLPFTKGRQKGFPHKWWTENLTTHSSVVRVERALLAEGLRVKVYGGKEQGVNRNGNLPLVETAAFFQTGMRAGYSAEYLARMLASYTIPDMEEGENMRLTGWRINQIMKKLDWAIVPFEVKTGFCGQLGAQS